MAADQTLGIASYFPEGKQRRTQDGGGLRGRPGQFCGRLAKSCRPGPGQTEQSSAHGGPQARASAQKESRAGRAPGRHRVGGKHRAVSRSARSPLRFEGVGSRPVSHCERKGEPRKGRARAPGEPRHGRTRKQRLLEGTAPSPRAGRAGAPRTRAESWFSGCAARAEEGQRCLARSLTASPLRLLGEEQEFLAEADASNYINLRKKHHTALAQFREHYLT